MVSPLASALGVTPQELLAAGEDAATRRTEADAARYRAWRAVILWTSVPSLALTIVVTFIVNLAVDHALTTFWVVLSAAAIVFGLIVWPLLAPRRPSVGLGVAGAALLVLLAVIHQQYAPGPWLAITHATLGFGTLLIYLPIWVGRAPFRWGRHRWVIALGLDSVLLLGLLYVIFWALERVDLWTTHALPISALALVIPWFVVLALVYLRFHWAYRVAIIIVGVQLYVRVVLIPAIGQITGNPISATVNLAVWDDTTVYGNTALLTSVAAFLGAGLLALGTALRPQEMGRSEPAAPQGSRSDAMPD